MHLEIYGRVLIINSANLQNNSFPFLTLRIQLAILHNEVYFLDRDPSLLFHFEKYVQQE